MRVVIVDKSSILGDAARRVLSSVGAATSCAASLHELSHAFETQKLPDLLIVNVTSDLACAEVAARIELSGYRGPVLVLVDSVDDPQIQCLTRLPHVDRRGRARARCSSSW